MDKIEQEILDIADDWANAIVANDAKLIGGFMADDWVIVGENGATGKKEFLSWVESGTVTHEAMYMVSKPRIRIFDNMAILTARVKNNGHYNGQPFSAGEWTTDVFIRHENGWLCVTSHITPSDEGKC